MQTFYSYQTQLSFNFYKELLNSRTREKIPRSNVDLLVTHTFFTQNSWFRFDECHHYRIVWHFLAFKPRILLQFSNHFCHIIFRICSYAMIASLFRPFFLTEQMKAFFALCLGGNVLFVSDVSFPKGNENTRDVSFCILLSSTLSKRITQLRNQVFRNLAFLWLEQEAVVFLHSPEVSLEPAR